MGFEIFVNCGFIIQIKVHSYSVQLSDRKTYAVFCTENITLRCVIPVVCVTNEREESVVNQHNLFRKMLYSNNETTCFGL